MAGRKVGIIGVVKGWADKIVFRIKLWEMDDWWRYIQGNHYELFAPSFYYTHTEEEIERITAETRVRIRALINKLGN